MNPTISTTTAMMIMPIYTPSKLAIRRALGEFALPRAAIARLDDYNQEIRRRLFA
jgi:hypothetical protein